ncbi:MAG TPA: TIGR03986 family CRISPR-associated RAMP protein, partial [Synergistaceae bacterium]|nr:TIGR03986 family CRISPR-associated RAMP protein [Synergistaceae bacterium]
LTSDTPSAICKSMGLAMMYRLPYAHSIHETIRHTNPRHCDGGVLDLGEQIFGRVEDQDALRGRVAVETLVAEGKPQPMPVVSTVLGAPKPTFYPNYVKQHTDVQGNLTGNYKTYMNADAEIRGWKRYLPPKDGEKPTPKAPLTENVATAFRPLPPGTVFSGRVVGHNLRPREMGALVWALTWGGNSQLRHILGMGKPYGYGSVTVEIVKADLRWNDPTKTDDLTLESCRKAFEDAMEKWWGTTGEKGSWKGSDQVRALLALANPGTPWPHGRAYPVLEGRNNEFVDAKIGRLVLASPVPAAAPRPAAPRPPVAPPAPKKDLSPVEQFLQDVKGMSANDVPKLLKARGLTPETVAPEERRRIYQALAKHPGASNWNFKKEMDRWKP